VQYTEVQYCTVRYSAVQTSTVQYSARTGGRLSSSIEKSDLFAGIYVTTTMLSVLIYKFCQMPPFLILRR